MKVAVISGILHPKYGGPPSVIQAHVKGLSPAIDTKVFGVVNRGEEEELKKIYPGCELFPAAFPKRWFRGKGLRKALLVEARNFDVLHAHMLWDHAVWASLQAGKKHKKPVVVTPHGSILNVWRWRPFHKISYRELILKLLFKDKVVMHALNEEEKKGCLEFGVKCPIYVIPNGLPELEYEKTREPQQALEKWPILRKRRVLLYMGRLSKLKGLDILLSAWEECLRKTKNEDWLLVIAGPDYRGYKEQIVAEIEKRELSGSVLLTGPVFGELKDSLLAVAEVFVLPSYTEGFSMAILEAMSAKLPCLYSTECHFRELAEKGGGWEILPKANHLMEMLTEIFGQTPEKLKSMGLVANELGRTKFTLKIVTQQLKDMYREALLL